MKRFQWHLAWVVPILSLAATYGVIRYQINELLKWRDDAQEKIETLLQWKSHTEGQFDGWRRARGRRGNE